MIQGGGKVTRGRKTGHQGSEGTELGAAGAFFRCEGSCRST